MSRPAPCWQTLQTTEGILGWRAVCAETCTYGSARGTRHTRKGQRSLLHGLNLLYLSTSLLWWQAVAGIRGVKSSDVLRSNSRCTWRYREGSRNVHTTAIRRVLSPSYPCGSIAAVVLRQTFTAAPEAWHPSGTLSRAGIPRWCTREEQRPHRRTMPQDAIPARLLYFRLLTIAFPSCMIVRTYCYDNALAELLEERQ